MRGISLQALSLLMLASGLASAQETNFSGLQLSGDQPLNIESDKLEVREEESVAIFSGNVNVVQGPTQLKSGRMLVYYVKGGSGSVATGTQRIDRVVVENKVYVKSNAQVATGDAGTFDMKSEVLTLTGKEVVLTEGGNILTGCKLTVQMKSGQAKLDGCGTGRVKVQITPGAQSN